MKKMQKKDSKILFTTYTKHVIIKNVKIKYTTKILKKMALVKPFFYA
jgi:hypothetical protein